MSQWAELMKGKVFITDLGENQISIVNQQETVVGRYAVWSPVTNSTSHQIIEVNENLDMLMSKYKIPEERVCRLA